MSNLCFNRAIITHDDRVKVSDLYRISAGDFFTFILPPPIELCNKDSLQNKEYNLEEFGADNLESWRSKNWGNGRTHLQGWNERTISENGDYMTMRFDTSWVPAIGIYRELEKQGYRIKAYFWEPSGCVCGTYIYGILEFINYVNCDADIPPDLDWIYGVDEYRKKFDCPEKYTEFIEDEEEYNMPITESQENTMSYFQNVANGK